MRVRFHLPDFTEHFRFNLVFAHMLKNRPDYFREGVEIASFYGAFPPSLWNGGRTIGGQCDESFVKGVIKSFNDLGIPLRFTFTNPVLKEEHLYDPFCNRVMELANNGFNEVIVNSPLLEDYIRKTYPDYKLTSSTCKRLDTEDGFLNELKKDYSIVVMDYDLNNKFDILEKVPMEDRPRIEFLSNACCNPKCPNRKLEYDLIGEQMIYYNKHLKEHPELPFDINDYTERNVNKLIHCNCRQRTLYEIKDLPTHISPDAIWGKYAPMGFEQFKLEGRTAGNLYLIDIYMYYMTKPECRDEARMMFFYNLDSNGVIQYES
ncbi:hypothetical protein [Ruminococcus flavefaciens]|uniref:Collagenase-like protease, PrtC family n=1 Tax=Ruminococcus flavefaciens TaxID=1265 RepID=A0A315Y1X2_RUMFL|nr:hypothetical protein [Ruminococcus flavefaciens]PWJ13398.1 hypothetical protein IE37_01201 [Ruminococcus flavefaciens]SSA47911.1 hypothetical protein SAMN02910325_01201 [Ruminococcus flavefaciens]